MAATIDPHPGPGLDPHRAPDEHHGPEPRPRPAWFGPAVVAGVTGVATAYTAWQDPYGGGVFPQCPTLTLLGVDCPGCGGLRATHSLAHLDLAAALDHNVLVVVLLPLLVAGWALWLARSMGWTRLRVPRPPAAVWWALGLTTVVFSVVRNIGGVELFEYLNSAT